MKILITADFCPNYRGQALVEQLDISNIFNDFQDVIDRSDYVITNLECPIAPDVFVAIDKIGPVLFTSEKAVEVLQKAGFNLLTLANNHIKDLGEEGIDHTINIINKYKLDYVGAGQGINNASKTFYVGTDKKIGIINITENEFSTTFNDEFGAHSLDIINNSNSIREAKSIADYVIVIYHGGHEGYQYPSPRMKKTFKFFADCGADAVICHHAHCYSGYEIYNDVPIFYGLGNFFFDWKNMTNKSWNEGYAVELELDSDVKFKIIPYKQCDEIPGIRLLDQVQQKAFLNKIASINNIISKDSELIAKFEDFSIKRSVEYDVHLQPYTNRILRGLYRRKLLPNLITKKKRKVLLNLVRCESHLDLFRNNLMK